MPRYISNKKLYDTDTAEAIATYEHSYKSQFNWYRETLYRTAKGNWLSTALALVLAPMPNTLTMLALAESLFAHCHPERHKNAWRNTGKPIY